jgi:hypothetical protein
MRTYFFDLRGGGVPVRDRCGLTFATASEAIEHGKRLAQKLRDDGRISDLDLQVCIVSETGAEIHREAVFPEKRVHGP